MGDVEKETEGEKHALVCADMPVCKGVKGDIKRRGREGEGEGEGEKEREREREREKEREREGEKERERK